MADSRNDSIESIRSSLSPKKKSNRHDKGDGRRITTSRSSDDMKGVSSPKGTRRLNSSTSVDNSNLGSGMHASPSSNNDSPRNVELMTEKEISSMVHSALIRARQATKSFSPRTRGYQSLSPRSDTLSPASVRSNRPMVPALSATSPSNRGRPPVYVASPLASPYTSRPPVYSFSSSPSKKTISVPSLNTASQDNDEAPYGPSSNTMRSNRTISSFHSANHYRSPISNASTPRQGSRGGGSVRSFDEFHTPISAGVGAVEDLVIGSRIISRTQGLEVDVGEQLSVQSSTHADYRKSFEMYESSTADQSTSSVESNNSSDDIIRRVEEEIANARKAAQEATRRLAGVSANFMAEVGSRSPSSPKNSEEDDDDSLDVNLNEMMVEAANDYSSSDDDAHFDSAINVISEEFDEILDYCPERKDPKNTDTSMRSNDMDTIISIVDQEFGENEDSVVAKSFSEKTIDLFKSCSEEYDNLLTGDLLTGGYNSCEEKMTQTCRVDKEEMVVSVMTEEKKKNDTTKSSPSDDSLVSDKKMKGIDNVDRIETSGKDSLYAENSVSIDHDISIERQESPELRDTSSANDILNSKMLDIVDMPSNESSITERFSRTRSIEECILDCVPADKPDVLSTEGSGQGENDEKNFSSGTKTVVSINKSIDDIPLDELEAVLSDEKRELQISYMKSEDTEVLDKKSRDQTAMSPEVSKSLSKDTATSERIPSDEVEPIENLEESVDAKETVEECTGVNASRANESLDDTKAEVECAKLKEQEDLGGATQEIENSVIPNGFNDVVDETVDGEEDGNESSIPEKNEEHFMRDVENLPSVNESKDDSKIQRSDDESSEVIEKEIISNKNSICDVAMTNDGAVSDDQATEVIDNRDHLTSRLLNNLSVKRDENMPPNDLKEPLTPTAFGKDISPSQGTTTSKAVEHVDTISCHGKKVKFKKRYPIPNQMKKLRQPSEIMFDYQLEKPSDKLWQSMPKKDLKELLQAVTGTSLQRRSNACGALKVLSTQEKNQMTLVRTQGFMDAVVFAISDSDYSIEDKDAGTAARTRAVNVVLNVSVKKDNRYHVLLHPGLRESLVKCMTEDKAEARELACVVLATLAKSQHCREPMPQTEKLVDALATILKRSDSPMFDADRQGYLEEKIDYSGDDELSRIVSTTFSSSSSSSSTNISSGDESVETQKEDSEMRRRTRMNACAALMHLSKECSISQDLCASDTLLSSLISCCKEVQNPIHTKCLEILANLTRFPQNNARLVEYPGLVDTLIVNGSQDDDSDRLWSMRIFQNLSCEPSAKITLASSSALELLSTNMMRKHYEEQLAATSTMYNISTEPGAVVPLTNTKNVVATLVHVAHSPMSVMELRTIASDALATLGLWLQTLASSGTVPEGEKSVPLPTYITSGWQRWE